jgi:hypothetical protein
MKFGLLALFGSADLGPNFPVFLCLGLIAFLAVRAWNRGRLGQDRLPR